MSLITLKEYDELIYSFYHGFSYLRYMEMFPRIPKLFYPEMIKRAVYARRYDVIAHIHKYVHVRDYMPAVSYENDSVLTEYIISLRKYTPNEWKYIKALLF
jgi:hypothetical protein